MERDPHPHACMRCRYCPRPAAAPESGRDRGRAVAGITAHLRAPVCEGDTLSFPGEKPRRKGTCVAVVSPCACCLAVSICSRRMAVAAD
jgi:hypothetical protein